MTHPQPNDRPASQIVLNYAVVALHKKPTLARRVLSAISPVGYFFAGVGLLAICLGLLSLLFRGASWSFLLVIIVAGLCLAASRREMRRRDTMRLLQYVELPLRLGLPVLPMLVGAVEGESGRVRKRLQATIDELNKGIPISRALASSVPEMTEREVDTLVAAEQNGSLQQRVDQLVRARRDQNAGQVSRSAGTVAYVGVVLAMLFGAIGMYLVFVVPKFASIMKDFQVEMPPSLRWLIRLASNTWLLQIGLVVSILWLAWIISMTTRRVFDSTADRRPGLLSRWLGGLAYRVPVIGGAIRDRDFAVVCRSVADGVRAHRPLDLALHEAKLPSLNWAVSRRVSSAAGFLHAGATPGEAMQRAGWPGVVGDLVASTRNDEQLASSLDFAATHFSSRLDRLRSTWSQAVLPLIVIALGGAVLLFCRSIFDSMSALFQAVINWSGLW
jgi:type IV pilus assembly protein PilC